MMPRELDAYACRPAPLCPDRHCRRSMKVRGLDWVCYHHAEPVRVRDLPRAYAEGRIEDHLGNIVDAVYDDGRWQTRTERF